MGGQNYGTFYIKKKCAPICALFGQIMCDFELKTIGNSGQSQNNLEDQVKAMKKIILLPLLPIRKRLPNLTPNPVIFNKNSRNMGKISEKFTYKKHF